MHKLLLNILATLLAALATTPALHAKIVSPTLPEGEPASALYRLEVDGITVPVKTRGDENYASWETDAKKVQIVVKVDRPDLETIPDVVVRPLSLKIRANVNREKREIYFQAPGDAHLVLDFGPNDANPLALLPFPVYPRPENKDASYLRYYGPGTHEIGDLALGNNERVFLDAGAIVLGNFVVDRVKTVRIEGSGELRGTIRCQDAANVSVDGTLLRNDSDAAITFDECDGVDVSHAKIVGGGADSSVGLRLVNTRNAVVTRTFLHSKGNALAIDVKDREATKKSPGEMIFWSNLLWSDEGSAAAIRAYGDFLAPHDVEFEYCEIIGSPRVATSIESFGNASTYNVAFRKINVEYDRKASNAAPAVAPSLALLAARPEKTPGEDDEEKDSGNSAASQKGAIRGITYEEVFVYGPAKPSIELRGFDAAHEIRDVVFHRVRLDGELVKEKNGVVPVDVNAFVRDVFFL
ncbi:MAG: hypothetical protein ACI4NP_04005 [Thermoguttaceae bacterium]